MLGYICGRACLVFLMTVVRKILNIKERLSKELNELRK